MKIKWCKLLGHKWIPVYVIGYFKNTRVKFVGSECKRCNYGGNDLRETIERMDNCFVNSYSEKYYFENKTKSGDINSNRNIDNVLAVVKI